MRIVCFNFVRFSSNKNSKRFGFEGRVDFFFDFIVEIVMECFYILYFVFLMLFINSLIFFRKFK